MTVIVFEGPDGSGKTGAINYVHQTFGLPMMSRASSSVDGPVPNLADWVDHFFDTWTNTGFKLLDRHPLISELVYGPIVHNGLREKFSDAYWLRSRVQEFRQKCVVVWCLPPFDTVLMNVQDDEVPQMTGVQENIGAIYWTYHSIRAAMSIPRCVTYDFTTSDAKPHLHKYIDWVIHHN